MSSSEEVSPVIKKSRAGRPNVSVSKSAKAVDDKKVSVKAQERCYEVLAGIWVPESIDACTSL